MKRRDFVRTLAVAAGSVSLGSAGCGGDPDGVPFSTPEETDAKFPQGIGSGDPRPNSVILWARVEPDDGTASRTLDVRVQLAEDPEFVDTIMYLTVNHEVAPKEQALGMDSNCGDCHFGGTIDWTELGWSDDPVLGGTRP